MKPIRDDIYAAMCAALEDNMGYVYCGRNKNSGPQLALGTLVMIARRGWVRLAYGKRTRIRNGQRYREIAGAWIVCGGRRALRDDVNRRREPMPARLVRPIDRMLAAANFTGHRPPSVTALVDNPFSLLDRRYAALVFG